jgi:hypothetical protein
MWHKLERQLLFQELLCRKEEVENDTKSLRGNNTGFILFLSLWYLNIYRRPILPVQDKGNFKTRLTSQPPFQLSTQMPSL